MSPLQTVYGREGSVRDVHRLEAAGRLREGERVAKADVRRQVGDRDADAGEDAEPDEGHLGDVRPDHGAVAAVRDVDDRGRGHRQGRGRLAPAEDDRQDERRRVQRDADRQPAREEEQEARQGASAPVEAPLEVLVRRVDPRAVEERHEGEAQHDHRERQAEVEGEEAHPRRVALPRRAHERDRADLGGHHGEAGRPPAHLAPREEEVGDVAGATADPHAEGDDRHDVGREDDPVRRQEPRQNGHREKSASRPMTVSAAATTAV